MLSTCIGPTDDRRGDTARTDAGRRAEDPVGGVSPPFPVAEDAASPLRRRATRDSLLPVAVDGPGEGTVPFVALLEGSAGHGHQRELIIIIDVVVIVIVLSVPTIRRRLVRSAARTSVRTFSGEATFQNPILSSGVLLLLSPYDYS